MALNTTEQDSHYLHLDQMSTLDLLEGMNNEDRCVPEAIGKELPAIGRLIDAIVERGQCAEGIVERGKDAAAIVERGEGAGDVAKTGGRIFYLGAGTSGRLGVVDASEIPPTYGVKGKFIGLIAGGDTAFRTAVEGAEDDWEQGWKDILPFNPTPSDTVIGISASGTAPYVIGAIRKARENGLLTGCICCNRGSALASECELPVEVVVGPEFVTGSTRMKAGTCAKLVLNMISTSVMILSGHVKGCKMVDMQLTNKKLVDRGTRMIMEGAGISDYEAARALLLKFGSVRGAVDAVKGQTQ